jgi:hypothetical protein
METSAFLESDFYCSHILYTWALKSMPKFFRQEVSSQIRVEFVSHLDERGYCKPHDIWHMHIRPKWKDVLLIRIYCSSCVLVSYDMMGEDILVEI